VTPESDSFIPHPEGGRFRRIWESELRLAPSTLPDAYEGARSAGTCIAYLLEPGERSRWHRVRSTELWLWQGGGPLHLTTGGTGSAPVEERTVVLGPEPGGTLAQVVAPLEWQRAEPAGDRGVRVACVVVPGFDWADWEDWEDGRKREDAVSHASRRGPDSAAPEP
jgi:predicted cupin superfamily sugar epimerase